MKGIIPDLVPQPSGEPTAVVFMPNHLGATGDELRHKALAVAKELSMLIVTYERTGTGSGASLNPLDTVLLWEKVRPENYERSAIRTAEVLDSAIPRSYKNLPRIMSGNSAGALDAIMVVRSQAIPIDYLAVGDPVGMRASGPLEFGAAWLKNQDTSNIEAPDRKHQIKMIKRAIGEAAAYNFAWRSEIGREALTDIAREKAFSHITTKVVLMGDSFIGNRAQVEYIERDLNMSYSERQAPFYVTVADELPHSHFNSAGNYSDLIRATANLEGLKQVA